MSHRIAIVTGAAGGLGRAVATRLAAHGYHLALVDIALENLQDVDLDSVGTRIEVESIGADITARSGCAAAVSTAMQRFGRVDVLVNTAGVYPRRPVLDIDAVDWQHVFDVNVLGTYFMAVEAIAVMRQTGSGHIVNVSSIDGFIAHPLNAHYAASKAAVISLTRSLALEVAPLGIRVNSVAPGPMATETAKSMDWYQPMVDELPTRRPIEPDEVAELVAFLCRPGNVSITGENVLISGGGVIA